jgi:hypothetical protein
MATMSINATTERGGTTVRARLSAVPWLTVVPLAVVLAYADGFWMIALRGSVGSIERTQEPFASWLRESTLTLPIFILAVLAALALAGWLKPLMPGWRRLVATALLVVAAGTVVGVAELTVSSAYDYRLQSAQLKEKAALGSTGSTGSMGSMGGTSAEQQHASAGLQMRAVGYGSGILLVTNLALVGWVVAMRGGRLNVRSTRH